MARKSLEERNIRKIGKSATSYKITLPIEFVRELGWRDNQKVVVKKKGQSLVIEDWKK